MSGPADPLATVVEALVEHLRAADPVALEELLERLRGADPGVVDRVAAGLLVAGEALGQGLTGAPADPPPGPPARQRIAVRDEDRLDGSLGGRMSS